MSGAPSLYLDNPRACALHALQLRIGPDEYSEEMFRGQLLDLSGHKIKQTVINFGYKEKNSKYYDYFGVEQKLCLTGKRGWKFPWVSMGRLTTD